MSNPQSSAVQDVVEAANELRDAVGIEYQDKNKCVVITDLDGEEEDITLVEDDFDHFERSFAQLLPSMPKTVTEYDVLLYLAKPIIDRHWGLQTISNENARMTNVEFVVDMMEHSRFGALSQLFVIESIRKWSKITSEATDEQLNMGQGLVSPEAWRGVAKEVLEKIEAKYSGAG